MRGRTRYPGAIDARAMSISPTSLPGYLFWLEADDLGLNEADLVASWSSEQGAVVAAQATSGNRPTFAAARKNGLAVVRAPGVDDYMLFSNLSASSGSFTLIAALSNATTPNSKYLLDSQTGRLIFAAGSGTPASSVAWLDSGGTWRDIAASTSGWQILSWVLTSGGNGEIFRNGTSLGTAAYTATALGGAIALFGAFNAGGAFLDCDLGEIMMFSSALSSAHRVAMETYLNLKWAVF